MSRVKDATATGPGLLARDAPPRLPRPRRTRRLSARGWRRTQRWSARPPPPRHPSRPALNGLRAFEANGADIEALGVERGHRTLVITRKGRKVVTIPFAPRTARVIDLAIGERCEGPIFLTPDGRRLDRQAPGGSSAG